MRLRRRRSALPARSGAGDYLKAELGAKIVAVEAVECPTMLYNGYGEHNIQGIGDKHVPFIHNVMNTDVVVGVSDRSDGRARTLLLNSEIGKAYLAARRLGLDPARWRSVSMASGSRASPTCSARSRRRSARLGSEDAIVTVATDGAAMYGSECAAISRPRTIPADSARSMRASSSARICAGRSPTITSSSSRIIDRERIFNLGYYTWVEQQGVPLADFDRRRDQAFWRGLQVCGAAMGRADRGLQRRGRRQSAELRQKDGESE